MTAQEHNKVLGLAHLGYGGLHLLMLLLFFIMFNFFLSLPIPDSTIISTMWFIMLIILGGGLMLALPSLIAGYALLTRKRWARVAATVAALPSLLVFPYGTALSVYTLWFISSNTGKEFYADSNGGWSPSNYSILPSATADNWASGGPYNQHERMPGPPQMRDWR
jgi:hypothetical protein